MSGLPVAGVVVAVAVFLTGAERLWRRAGRGRAVRGRHVAAWLAGVGVVLLASAAPVEQRAAQLAWVHMVQHLLLVLVAPVLLVLARPLLPLAWGLPERLRQRLPRRRIPVPALLGLAWTGHLVVLLGWHVPAAYQAALERPLVHAVEHASLLGVGVLLWGVLLRPDPRGRSAGTAAVAAATTGVLSGVVGVLLVFSSTAWYPWYAGTAPAHGLTAVEDQQLAGAIMWVAGGLAYAGAACWLCWRWLGAMARVASAWVVVLAVAAGLTGCTRGTPQPSAEVLGDIAEGRQLVEDHGCTTCHAVPGIAAQMGRVGPSLDGVASRRVIAGVLPNTPENLVRWVRDPQEVLPGNVMPDVGLTEEEARAVAAFLSTLE